MSVEVATPGSIKGLYDLETRAYSTRHLVIRDLDELSTQNQGNAVASLELAQPFSLLSSHLSGLLTITGVSAEQSARAEAVKNGMKLGILVGQKLVHDDRLMVSLEPISSRAHDPAELGRVVRTETREYLEARANLSLLVERYTGGYTTTPAEYADAVASSSFLLMLADCHLQTEHVTALIEQNLDAELAEWTAGE